jgi:hypothetical protein
MENLKIYLLSVHPACSCYVERKENGEIVEPDLNDCLVVRRMHHEAIKEAVDRLAAITKKGN